MLNLRKETIINAIFHIPKLDRVNFRNFIKFGEDVFKTCLHMLLQL